MKPANILMFEPYPFGRESGNFRTQSQILRFVDRNKFKIILVAPFESDYINYAREQGIKCLIVPPPGRIGRYGGKCLKDNLFGKLLNTLLLIFYNMKIWIVLKKEKIDLIYCNCIRAVICTTLAAKLRRKPLLWYVKGELQNRFLDTIGFILSDKILFICEANKNDKYPGLIKRYADKIGILKVWIVPKMILDAERKDKAKLSQELSISDEKVNLIVSGQLYAPKGVHYLIEALGMVVDRFPNVRLHIMGDHIIEEYKDYKNELINVIKKNKLENHVVFLGWRRDALEIVFLMDILIHPTLSEGLPLAVLEAMALGKPVVVSSVGGLRELIVDGENGFLVEPGNVKALADKIIILLNDKNLRDKFGQSARETVFSEYLVQDKICQLEKIWSGMIYGEG